MVLRLFRALYGLRKSPQLWYNEIAGYMEEIGLIPCPEEQCLFIHHNLPIYVFLYVDDFLLIAPRSREPQLAEIKRKLMDKYEFKDLGDAHQFLNIRITRDIANRKLWLSQADYIEKLVTKFD